MTTREQYLRWAEQELKRARESSDERVEWRRFLVEIAQCYIALAAETRAGEERADIEFELARRNLLKVVDD